ncbi:hypothetical protein [Thioflexithrix psekupsensis]|uniref:Glycosyltransferase RgtA/B/C/D-like domain-containing protein n=1 Tax=Thioflexithrix psekupsensis TaxID=1570016 RepID=A0A251X7X1_9GAMM|nr:hypothetical protein [Thioflexithrix psekupsensis]OUD14148.1 hypothetical protein TPSD3_07385 [Thioflexithrix psekupsensis]
MEFSAVFFQDTGLAVVVALLWFGVPGFLVLGVLGLSSRGWGDLLIAPAVGLCVFGAVSLPVTTVVGLNVWTLGLLWLGFVGGGYFWQKKIAAKTTISTAPLLLFYSDQKPSWFVVLALLALSALWATALTRNIYPFVFQEGLFVNTHIFDHAKVAMLDGIAREGVLPLNPYYAPEGERIVLIYYFLWHFMGAHIKLLTGAAGWPVDVAMTGITAFVTLNFLVALAFLVARRKVLASFLVIGFALLGPPADLLMSLTSSGLHSLIDYPRYPNSDATIHPLEVLWIQAAWVPQHVLSALAIVVMLFLVSRVLLLRHLSWEYAVIIGWVAATAFGSSTWVGGIALTLALPGLLLAMVALRLGLGTYWASTQTAVIAVVVCVLTAIPLFVAKSSGPSLAETQLPFGWGVHLATNLFAYDSIWGKIMHVPLFWVQFLPLNLGIFYAVGLLTLLLRQAATPEIRNFRYLSLGAAVTFLLIVQFVQSEFWNNTFGWRTVLVPVMLLLVWAGVGLSDLLDSQLARVGGWRGLSLVIRGQCLLVAVTMLGVMLGALATLHVYRLPDPARSTLSEREWQERRSFLLHAKVWEKVREWVGPNELVQVNPDGYHTLTPWPATLPYALFADRAVAYANVEYSTVFAYRYDAAQNRQTYALMQEIFSAQTSREALMRLRDVFKVKAILVDWLDPAWHGSAIAESGIYREVYADDHFRIFVAL